MEEKERYELFGEHCIKDNNPDARCQLLDTYKACVILNEQDKEIKELEETNKVLSNELTKNSILKQDHIETCCGIPIFEIPKMKEENQQLKQQLAEKERQYETLYKLFSEQHEIIDQNELGCFEEVNRLLKEQKDFYIVEKTEYDKMKQGAKDIVKELKQQLAEKEKEIKKWKTKWCDSENNSLRLYEQNQNKNQDKISFAVEQLENVKIRIQEDFDYDDLMYWLNKQIKMLKEWKWYGKI